MPRLLAAACLALARSLASPLANATAHS